MKIWGYQRNIDRCRDGLDRLIGIAEGDEEEITGKSSSIDIRIYIYNLSLIIFIIFIILFIHLLIY